MGVNTIVIYVYVDASVCVQSKMWSEGWPAQIRSDIACETVPSLHFLSQMQFSLTLQRHEIQTKIVLQKRRKKQCVLNERQWDSWGRQRFVFQRKINLENKYTLPFSYYLCKQTLMGMLSSFNTIITFLKKILWSCMTWLSHQVTHLLPPSLCWVGPRSEFADGQCRTAVVVVCECRVVG